MKDRRRRVVGVVRLDGGRLGRRRPCDSRRQRAGARQKAGEQRAGEAQDDHAPHG